MSDPGDRYPQLLRAGRGGWWRSLLGLIVAGGCVLAGGVAVVLLASAVGVALGTTADPLSEEGLAPDTPLGLLTTNLAIVTILPAVVLTVLLVHRARAGWLSSVDGRLRRGPLLRLLPVALVVVAVFFALTFLLPSTGSGTSEPPPGPTLLALLAVILLTTPLQAAAEEYGFRGYLSQVVASWIPRPAAGAVAAAAASAVLFALAHGAADPWLFADRLVFGLVASWLAWRTGGLEAAVALHVANNLVALGYAAATGTLADAFSVSAVDWRYVVLDAAMLITFAAVAAGLAGRWRLAVRRPPRAGPPGWGADPAAGRAPGGPAVLFGTETVGYPVQRSEAPERSGDDGHWGMG